MSEERKRKFEDLPAGEDSVKIPRVDGATGGQEETEDSKDLKPDLKPESDLKLEAAGTFPLPPLFVPFARRKEGGRD